MIPTTVVIPTRFDVSMIEELLPSLKEASKIFIMDNGLTKENRDKLREYKIFKIDPINCLNLSIYQMWNLGINKSVQEFGAVNVTILNDDIYFLPNTLSILAEFLRSDKNLAAVCPDYDEPITAGFGIPKLLYTKSTFGRGGLAGFAFMIKGELSIRVDENLKWWYGDDDLVKQIEATGYQVGKILGVPLYHALSKSYSQIASSLSSQIDLDMAYFNKKYGENRKR